MNAVDLFSGCGGFSLGAHQAGLSVPLAFDIDPILTSSFSRNFKNTKLQLADIGKLSGADIRSQMTGSIDLLFGGPPCQGFSTIGRRDAADPRRELLTDFYRLVKEIKPKAFVMENVAGLAYDGSRHVLDAAINMIADQYSILGPLVVDASDFGAATRRPRIFVIGVDLSRADSISEEDIARHKSPPQNVRAAISDLSSAEFLRIEQGYDVWKIRRPGRPSQYASSLRSRDGTFTGNQATAHSKEVKARFRRVPQGGVDAVGRHFRLDWTGQCPTLRAGTGSDRGSYQSVRPIHPEEPRVITVREAARLQGFPDWFMFHPTVWHSFRMIGNSVSPHQARGILKAVAKCIGSSADS